MPTITPPFTFADGTAIVADDFMSNLYDPLNSSYEKVNGHLDSANMVANTEIPSEVIQKGALSQGDMVGKVENTDYYHRIFSEISTRPGGYIVIAGCGKEFYVPSTGAHVLLVWQITIGNDQDEGGSWPVQTRLYVDGSRQGAFDHNWPAQVRTTGVRLSELDWTMNGHLLQTGLSAGWHNAYIALHSKANLCRVRARNFKVIIFT